MSLKLIKALLNKEFYDKYKHKLSKDFFISDNNVKGIFQTLEKAYETIDDNLTVDSIRELHYSYNPTITLANKKVLESLFEEIKKLDLTKDTSEVLLKQAIEQALWTEIANIGIQGGDGLKTDFVLVQGILDSIRDGITLNTDIKVIEGTIAQMLEATSQQMQWKFHIPTLKTRVEGIGKSTFTLIAARPNCFSDDTEVLTDKGWKYIKDTTKRDNIGCVTWGGGLIFDKFIEKIKQPVKENLLHIYDAIGRCDMLVTKDHDIAYSKKGSYIKKDKLSDLGKLSNKEHIMSAKSCLLGKKLTAYERFLIAYQADGSAPRKGCTGERGHFTVRFGFSKQRKIDRLISILEDAKLEYHVNVESVRPDYKTIYVEVKDIPPKTFSWVNLNDVGYLYARDFIEEVSHWDATIRTKNRIKYDTRAELNADVVQTVACMAGYAVKYTKFNPYKTNHSFNHSLSIRTNTNRIGMKSFIIEEVPYIGNVYCLKVKTGLLLCRRNKKTFVSGNCGKTALTTSLIAQPEGFLDQGAHITYIGNEEAAVRTRLRMASCYTGMPRAQFYHKDKLEEAEALWKKAKERLTVLDMAGYSIEELQKYIKDQRTPIDILIVDVIDKLHIDGSLATEHDEIYKLYTIFRELLKKYDIAGIGTSQASADAENRAIFGMDCLVNSKTGKGGELDLCLCLGRHLQEGEVEQNGRGMRTLNIPKNKLTGIEDYVTFSIDFNTSRVRA